MIMTAIRPLPLLLALLLPLAGCKTQNSQSSQSALQSTASSNEVDKFTTVDDRKFEQMRQDRRAEFFGCLCVNKNSEWQSWKFLQVASHGYKATVSSTPFSDLEACVASREASQSCGG